MSRLQIFAFEDRNMIRRVIAIYVFYIGNVKTITATCSPLRALFPQTGLLLKNP